MQTEHLAPYLPTEASISALQEAVRHREQRARAVADGFASLKAAIASVSAEAVARLIGDGESNPGYYQELRHVGGWSSVILLRYGYMPVLEIRPPGGDSTLIRPPGGDSTLIRTLKELLNGDRRLGEKLTSDRPGQPENVIQIWLGSKK